MTNLTNFKRIFASLFCLVSLVCLANASDTPDSGSWSNWIHDEHVLPELYLRSRCVQDPTNAKKALWEIQFEDVGSALVEVKGKDWKYEVPPNQQVGTAHFQAKNCSKPQELKMDGRVPVKNYDYKLTYKDRTLTVKPHEHVDWGGWITAGMMAGAAMTQTMAQNDAQIAEVRAQQQAEQQAAAQARALQAAQLQATYAQQRAAQQQVQAQQAAQQQAQLVAQQAAQQQAQLVAQQAASRASGGSSRNSGGDEPVPTNGPAGSSNSTPAPNPQDLSITSVSVLDLTACQIRYTVDNASYVGAYVDVQIDVRDNGVETHTVFHHDYIGPRSSYEFGKSMNCGSNTGDALNNYANTNIVGYQFQ
jgi:hypothetical protein